MTLYINMNQLGFHTFLLVDFPGSLNNFDCSFSPNVARGGLLNAIGTVYQRNNALNLYIIDERQDARVPRIHPKITC